MNPVTSNRWANTAPGEPSCGIDPGQSDLILDRRLTGTRLAPGDLHTEQKTDRPKGGVAESGDAGLIKSDRHRDCDQGSEGERDHQRRGLLCCPLDSELMGGEGPNLGPDSNHPITPSASSSTWSTSGSELRSWVTTTAAPPPGADLVDDLVDQGPGGAIEGVEGLIEQQELHRVKKEAGEIGPAFHPRRTGAGQPGASCP